MGGTGDWFDEQSCSASHASSKLETSHDGTHLCLCVSVRPVHLFCLPPCMLVGVRFPESYMHLDCGVKETAACMYTWLCICACV